MTSEKNSIGDTLLGQNNIPVFFVATTSVNMKLVRSILCPSYEICPFFTTKIYSGDTWTGEGHEAHDFRKNFGISGPFMRSLFMSIISTSEKLHKTEKFFIISHRGIRTYL